MFRDPSQTVKTFQAQPEVLKLSGICKNKTFQIINHAVLAIPPRSSNAFFCKRNFLIIEDSVLYRVSQKKRYGNSTGCFATQT